MFQSYPLNCLQVISSLFVPVGDSSVEDMDNAIRAFSKNQWDILTEEVQCEIFAKHTIYLYGEFKQRLMPHVTQFNALS